MNEKKSIEDTLAALSDVLSKRPSVATRMAEILDGAAVPDTPRQKPRYRSSLRRVAAFGASVVAVCCAIWMFGAWSGGARAFAQVQQTLREVRSAAITITFPDRPGPDITLYFGDSGKCRLQDPRGLVLVYDPEHGKALAMNSQDKTAWFVSVEENMISPWNYVDQILRIHTSAAESLGRRIFGNRSLVGFRIQPSVKAADEGIRFDVWIDPDTRLPVRGEEVPTNLDEPTTMHRRAIAEFEFNTAIDPNLFSVTPPTDYRMVDQGPNISLDRPNDPNGPSTIVEGAGIGAAEFGMTLQDVTRVLGPPSELWYVHAPKEDGREYHSRVKEAGRDLEAYRLEYKNRGYSLRVSIRDGLAEIVTAGEWEVLHRGFNRFGGSTQLGVRLGSTRQDAEQLCGSPSRIRGPKENPFAILYESHGLAFALEDGRIMGIQAWKPHPK